MHDQTLGIAGYGRFGAALCDLAENAGFSWVAFDPVAAIPQARRVESLAQLAGAARWILVCTPVHAFESTLDALAPHLTARHVVMDVGSVKVLPEQWLRRRLADAVPWVATHPLFGPVSLARGDRPLRVVVCDNPLHPETVAQATELYEALGCEVVHQSADHHDREMARTHALVFFIAKGLLQLGEQPLIDNAPASYRAIAQAVEAVRADAGHLFVTIQNANPHSGESRRALLEALQDIEERLNQRRLSHDAGVDLATDPLAIAAPAPVPPELQQTRQEIDKLDTELLALLARRARLSRRALHAKAAKGQPVRDPARETALLDDRATSAVALGLDAEGVRDVFAAILRQSRSLQRGL